MNQRQTIVEIQERFHINLIYAKSVFLSLDKAIDKDNLFKDIEKIIKDRPKPFVKWVGGKRQLLKQFRDLGLYPPEGFNPEAATYFEPFVGGGAVFLDLLPRRAVLSDMNKELVTTYNVIKKDADALIRSLKKHKNSKEYFLAMRAKDIKNLSDVQIASRFIYLNRTCFNGLYRVNRSGQFNTPYGKYKNPLICDEVNLRKIAKYLKNVSIKHQDYKEVLKKAKKGDFVYFDPPYYPVSKTASFTAYTSDGFFDKEQMELRDAFQGLNERGCFVMLSNSDTPFINTIYGELKNSGVKIHKVDAGRAINAKASGRGKIKEVLVTNY